MYRADHGADPLEYDPDLADDAQEYAQYLSENNLWRHDPNLNALGQGENLAMYSDSRLGSTETENIYSTRGLDSWYNEVHTEHYFRDFDVEDGPPSGTGHFTQVVWKGTTNLGCGTSGRILVCRYSPPGNMRMISFG